VRETLKPPMMYNWLLRFSRIGLARPLTAL